MPLPTQVVEKLSREPLKTPGWSGGILFYSGGLLAVVFVIYCGISFVYAPILRAQISGTEDQINKLNESISSADQSKLITYYSQIANLRSLVKNHSFFSPFLTWLETHTEGNVSYATLNFSTGNQVALTGSAKTQADLNQQIAIFQSAPEVKAVSISNVTLVPAVNLWQFSVSLVMQPSVFAWQQQ